jgi:polysaccharide deacetylase 2 family uncharacterized protein YibQ
MTGKPIDVEVNMPAKPKKKEISPAPKKPVRSRSSASSRSTPKKRSTHKKKTSRRGTHLITLMIFTIIFLSAGVVILDQRAMKRGHIGLWETVAGISPATTSDGISNAYLKVLEDFGITRQNLRREGWTTIAARNNERLRHNIFIVENNDTFQLLTAQFEDRARKNGVTVHNRHIIKKPGEWILTYYIGTHGERTHKLDLSYLPIGPHDPVQVTDPVPPEAERSERELRPQNEEARIALIFDDFGPNMDIATRFLTELDVPVTLAVLPYQSHSVEIIKKIRAAGQTAFLHIPMEPHNSSAMGELAAHYLLVSMDDETLRARTLNMLNAHPGVIGVNNHTGSKMTENTRTMNIILSELKNRNLIFVDSRTSANSIAESLAIDMDLPASSRDVFLDQGYHGGDVKANMLKLAEIARKDGSAIGIGHAIDTTLEDVSAVLPQILADNVTIVPIQTLVK